MKRMIGLAVSAVAALSCISVFAGCANQKQVKDVNLVFDYEKLSGNFYYDNEAFVSDADNKYYKHVLYGDYGNELDLDEIVSVYCSYDNSQSDYIMQKTDLQDGYVLESNLPDKQGVGEYTVKYTYAGWTNELVVRINTRKIACPGLAFDDEGNLLEYYYNGSSITPEFIYESEYINMVTSNIAQTNAGDYTVTFALKDKENTAWDSVDAQGKYSTEDYDVVWQIWKQSVLIGKSLLNLSNDEIAAIYNETANTFTFDHTGEAIACPVNANLIDFNKVEILYGTNSVPSEWTLTRPKDPGTYYVYLRLKDEKNYTFKGFEESDNAPNMGNVHQLTTMIIK